MSERHHVGARNVFNMLDERRHIISPLRPRIDVAPLTFALAMTPQVERKGAHAMPGHRLREPGITAGMLAEAVYDRKRNVGARLRPRPVGEPCTVSRLDRAGPGHSALRHRGARIP